MDPLPVSQLISVLPAPPATVTRLGFAVIAGAPELFPASVSAPDCCTVAPSVRSVPISTARHITTAVTERILAIFLDFGA